MLSPLLTWLLFKPQLSPLPPHSGYAQLLKVPKLQSLPCLLLSHIYTQGLRCPLPDTLWLLSSCRSFQSQIKGNCVPEEPSLKYHPLFCPQTEEIILQDLVLISLIILYLPLQSDCGDLRTGLGLIYLFVYFLLQDLALYLAHLSRIMNAHSVITCHIREPSRWWWWACNRNSKAYRLALASCIVLQWVLI